MKNKGEKDIKKIQIQIQNKNTLKLHIDIRQLSIPQRINHNLNVCVSKVFT